VIVGEPKQARSVATRGRILQAACEALMDRGYGGASTQVIATLAGVSQGALFKHFATKAALLASSIEQLLAGFIGEFRRGLGDPTDREPLARVAPAVAELWKIFRRPEMQAVLEVYLAARTDRALGAALGPILDRHRENILAEARRILPELAGVTDFSSVVDAVVYAMQGVIVGVFTPDRQSDAVHLAFFERLALRELEAVLSGGSS
jgi:AcrR family transcriptional regulator